jgi:hypothetical protein
MKNLFTLLFVGIAMFCSNSYLTQEITVQSGVFGNDATWVSGNAPYMWHSSGKINTDCVISAGHTVTRTGNIKILNGTSFIIEGTLIIQGFTDFVNGCNILVTSTGTLILENGENSNNSTDVTIDGTLIVNGDFYSGNGSNTEGSGTVTIYGESSGAGSIMGAQAGCTACNFSVSTGSTDIPSNSIGGNIEGSLPAPVEPYYYYTYSQTIYTAAELNASGLTAGSNITSLKYQYSSSSLSNSDDWTVWIGHTSKDDFSSTTDWEPISGLTQFALNQTPSIGNGGVVSVAKNGTAFEWDGTSNIVIATHENASGYGSSSNVFYGYNTGSSDKTLLYRGYYSHQNPDPASPPTGELFSAAPCLSVVATDAGCVSVFPLTLDFESGITWEASGPSSTYTWLPSTSTTPSSGTGPASASVFGSGSSTYAYCETSSYYGSEFTLTTNCLNMSSVQNGLLNFEYHAYGSNIGKLEAQTSDDGNTWITAWSVTGQQHSSGSEAATAVSVGLNAISGREGVYVRFKYTSGSSLQSDIAIDNVTIDQANSWVGNSTDWFDAANWTAGVPTAETDASIPASSSSANPPTIMGANASVKTITFEAGSQMIIEGNTLNVYGNWVNNGDVQMTPGASKINFAGSDQNVLTGGVQNLENVQVSNSAGIVLESGTYNIYGAFDPDGGSVVTNNNLVIASNSSKTGRILKGAPAGFVVTLLDSYGDGWDGSYLQLRVDGVVQETYNTFTSGYSQVINVSCQNISFSSTVSFYYVGISSWENEHGLQIDDAEGNNLYYDNDGAIGSGTKLSTGLTAGNPFTGDVIVQQHLATSNNGWRELTSGVKNMTLNDLLDDGLYMSGFTGSMSTYPSWCSVYTFDESQCNGDKNAGWVAATNVTNAVAPQSAHRMYTGASTYNLVLTGTPGYGDYTYNINRDNSTANEIAAASDQKGWNFVGNPYPCPISWDAVSKNNIDDAIWIYSAEAGNYGLYVGGAGAGSGTNGVDINIAAHQGVWVHATGSGARVVITEDAKVDESQSLVKSNGELPFFKIRITNNSNSYKDEVILAQDQAASLGLDNTDGYKLFTSIASAPSLWLLADTTPVTLNRVPVSSDFNVDLHYSSTITGSHTLLFTNQDVMNFNGCLVLEDMELNSYTPISDSLEYIFNSDPLTALDVRFKLHYYPTSEVTSTDAVCQGSADGSIAVEFGGIPPFSATLTSSASVTTVFNDSVGVFENLTPGSYELEIGGGKGCANEQFQLEIVDPLEIMIAKDVTDVSAASGCDGAIRLEAMGGVSPYTYYINGIEGNELGSLCAGTYDVIVVDANGCSKLISVEVGSPTATSVLDLTAVSFAAYPNPSNGNFTVFSKGQTHLRIYSVTGQVVKDLKFNKSKAIDMTDVESGVYILRDMETGDMTEVVVI